MIEIHEGLFVEVESFLFGAIVVPDFEIADGVDIRKLPKARLATIVRTRVDCVEPEAAISVRSGVLGRALPLCPDWERFDSREEAEAHLKQEQTNLGRAEIVREL